MTTEEIINEIDQIIAVLSEGREKMDGSERVAQRARFECRTDLLSAVRTRGYYDEIEAITAPWATGECIAETATPPETIVLVTEITERQQGRADVIEWMRTNNLVKAAVAAEKHFNIN